MSFSQTAPVPRSPFWARLSFGCFLLLVGVTFGALFTYYQHIKPPGGPRQSFSTEEIAKTRKLARKLHDAENKNTDLESELVFLNREMTRKTIATPSSVEFQRVSRLLGLTPLSGPGLEISVKDASKAVAAGENPNTGIVHNFDLQQIVNHLWAAGAEGITINEQRIVASTEITCAGPIILVNHSRIASPFVIQVIGDLPRLEQRLNARDSYLKYLASYGIEVQSARKAVFLPPRAEAL